MDADIKAALDREISDLIELMLAQRRAFAKIDPADPLKDVARGMLQGMSARMSALLERRNKLAGQRTNGVPFD